MFDTELSRGKLMIRIVTIVLVTLFACAAVAQDCQMIVLFESDGGLVDQMVADAGPLAGHLVLFSAFDEVTGFEASLEITPEALLLVLAVSGPNGFTNFGDLSHFVVGYGTPLPTGYPTILCSLDLLAGASANIEVCVTDAVVSADGNSYPCQGECSEINPTVGVEATTFSAVKGLF
jgi:hypothetical protein